MYMFASLQIRRRFDKGQDVDLSDANPHDVASVLKEFFRSLPEPLMTRDLYGPILSTRSKKRGTEGEGERGGWDRGRGREGRWRERDRKEEFPLVIFVLLIY